MSKRTDLGDKIIEWHASNGGFAGSASGHACRILREVVELCFASGATVTDIANAVMAEVKKETARSDFAKVDKEKMLEEASDVFGLFHVFETYFLGDIFLDDAIEKKLGVLEERLWEVDGDGVLWRPGSRTELQLYPDDPDAEST